MLEQIPVIIPVSLLVFALLTFLAGTWRKELAFPVALTGVSIALAASIAGLVRVLRNGPQHYYLGGWLPPIGIEYVFDHLAAFMAILITSVGLLSLIYSLRPFQKEASGKTVPLYTLVVLFLAGLTGIVVTGDLFNVYVFLEIASLSAYAMIAAGSEKAPVAAIRYIILGTVGACFYVLGVGFIYFATGSLNMGDIARILPALGDSRLIVTAAVFIVIGMGLKMALFPFHVWLPDAYTYAPSGVITFVAPLMTKVFAYVALRMLISVFTPGFLTDVIPVMTVVSWLAAAGIIFASIMAIAQKDLRRMLAYSSVAQICYVALGIGLANAMGLIGAMLHILNHAVMKACLFQACGSIKYRTGFWRIPDLAGLGRRMPWMMGAFTIAAISMIGIPPLAGFFSKWYLVLGSIDAGNWVFVAVILVSSLLNAVYFFRVLDKAYFAAPEGAGKVIAAQDPPLSMLSPMVTLAAGVIVLGLINVTIVSNILRPVVALVP